MDNIFDSTCRVQASCLLSFSLPSDDVVDDDDDDVDDDDDDDDDGDDDDMTEFEDDTLCCRIESDSCQKTRT